MIKVTYSSYITGHIETFKCKEWNDVLILLLKNSYMVDSGMAIKIEIS